ncbi:MAG: hypothetical protein GWP05_09000 [Anaerolineaceae bacterium]|nr:hypothetical protein [Anaerolineaceae bacterium]
MEKIIQKMLEVEQEGRRLLKEARSEAKLLVAEAQQRGELRRQESLQAARREAARLVEAAEAKALEDKAQMLDQRGQSLQDALRVSPSEIEQAVETVCRTVLGQ